MVSFIRGGSLAGFLLALVLGSAGCSQDTAPKGDGGKDMKKMKEMGEKRGGGGHRAPTEDKDKDKDKEKDQEKEKDKEKTKDKE